jgi:hypothetical protein
VVVANLIVAAAAIGSSFLSGRERGGDSG